MSKILEATCLAGIVKQDGSPVAAEVFSEGVGQSEGLLLLEKEKAYYLTSNASDLKTTIEKLVEAVNKVTETLTAIGAGMTGPTTAPPPTLAANVALITALTVELTTLKGSLK